jgi:hypothetical protein
MTIIDSYFPENGINSKMDSKISNWNDQLHQDTREECKPKLKQKVRQITTWVSGVNYKRYSSYCNMWKRDPCSNLFFLDNMMLSMYNLNVLFIVHKTLMGSYDTIPWMGRPYSNNDL